MVRLDPNNPLKKVKIFQHYLISQILSFHTPLLEVHHLSKFMSKIEQICKHVYKTPYNNQGCLVFGVKFWTLLVFYFENNQFVVIFQKKYGIFLGDYEISIFFLNRLVIHFAMQFKELILAN